MNLPSSTWSDPNLVFLKLGGSLITDKHAPRTAREEIINRICGEITRALRDQPSLKLVLGHGSGSFGHFSGDKYRTREGVSTPEDWQGFAEVWGDAAALNTLVMSCLRNAGQPAVAFPPSASVVASNREISSWDLAPLRSALENRLLPVVYGDVVFDTKQGGTILSTEELFSYLARELKPGRILLAGLEEGVWQDYPECTRLAREITPTSYPGLLARINPSEGIDVTGGMRSKVEVMLDLVSQLPGLRAAIFSGEKTGSVSRALAGESLGTTIRL